MSRVIIGVMGGNEVDQNALNEAYQIGRLIAYEGWVLLTGGKNRGVMNEAARGAKDNNGLTIGILPESYTSDASDYIDICILTGLGAARNNINVLTSQVIVALPGKAGTISEVALALKNSKHVILLNFDLRFIFDSYSKDQLLQVASTPEEAIDEIKKVLSYGQYVVS